MSEQEYQDRLQRLRDKLRAHPELRSIILIQVALLKKIQRTL